MFFMYEYLFTSFYWNAASLVQLECIRNTNNIGQSRRNETSPCNFESDKETPLSNAASHHYSGSVDTSDIILLALNP